MKPGRGGELAADEFNGFGRSAMKVATNNPSAGVAEQGTNLLRDIKPPVHVPGGWEWVGWTLGAILVLALACCAWWYWRKRRTVPAPEIVVPAHVRARQRLQEALMLIDRPKEFCITVSDTVRAYLEERFDFRAPERTTEEFLRELSGSPWLRSEQKRSLGEFLEKCDLVKFAKYEPGEPELRDLHASALRLVEETAPVAEESSSSPAAAPRGGQAPLIPPAVPSTEAPPEGERPTLA